jgi:hypothetical protein
MNKRPKCRPVYRLKVRSQKTGQWKSPIYGCSRKSLERAAQFYTKEFGVKAKIVKG